MSLRVPDDVRVEFEVEVDGDEIEIEIELKWSTSPPPSVRSALPTSGAEGKNTAGRANSRRNRRA